MGSRAMAIFEAVGIEVVTADPRMKVRETVEACLEGSSEPPGLGRDLDSLVDQRFARCPPFLLVDTRRQQLRERMVPVRVAVWRGKGGTRKTFLSTNQAWVSGAQMADCDVEEPNVHFFLSPEGSARWGMVPQG